MNRIRDWFHRDEHFRDELGFADQPEESWLVTIANLTLFLALAVILAMIFIVWTSVPQR